MTNQHTRMINMLSNAMYMSLYTLHYTATRPASQDICVATSHQHKTCMCTSRCVPFPCAARGAVLHACASCWKGSQNQQVMRRQCPEYLVRRPYSLFVTSQLRTNHSCCNPLHEPIQHTLHHVSCILNQKYMSFMIHSSILPGYTRSNFGCKRPVGIL